LNNLFWVLVTVNSFVVLLSIYFAIFVFPHQQISEETKRRPRSFISNAFFREFWYFVMEPLKKKLIDWNVSPNTITIWGLIFSVAAGVCFLFGDFGSGGWMIILASTCDVYDGMLARAQKITLKSGAFFDSTMDRISEAVIFGGIMWVFRTDPVWYSVAFVGAMSSQIVSYARARAEGLGFDKGGSRGFFQRAERMIVLSILLPLTPVLELWLPERFAVKLALFIIFIGSLQTAFARSIGIYREIRKTES
jgi:CDP-diacylglycerol--glycerol-3-phosphate 3-phosphatidyltransferase